MMAARAEANSLTTGESLDLKKTKSGVILHPQPHDNPNDPLNWPLWRRDMALLVIGWHSFIGGGQTPILAAGLTGIGQEFHTSPSTTAFLVGGFMLAMGAGSIVASPTAALYGKRFVYLMGIVLAFAGSIWAACANSFGSLMGARVLIGLGVAPCESLPSSSISEIFFLHERAYRLGFYSFLLLGGKNLVPLLASFVFEKLDRRWLFWILAIVLFIDFVLLFFFAPETFWERVPIPDKRSREETAAAREALKGEEVHNSFAYREEPSIVKKTFVQELRMFHGRHSRDKWWMVLLRPFVLLLYPNILFGALIYTFAVVWLILISETISHIFTHDPYNYSRIVVGLFYVSPFIGGTLGSVVAGKISDFLARYLVRRNNGQYEPEFRLLMLAPVLVTVVMGLIGFGWASEVHDIWIGPVVFFGILGFGCSLASTTAITYTVDSYKMFAMEALVTLNVMKNVIGFVFSLFNNSFIDSKGAKIAFSTFGIVQAFLCVMGVFVYVFGKRMRRFTDKKEWMKYLYLREDD